MSSTFIRTSKPESNVGQFMLEDTGNRTLRDFNRNTEEQTMTLELVSSGEQCEIVEIRHCGGCGGGCHEDMQIHGRAHVSKQKNATRAEEMGLSAGTRVEMLKNDGDRLLLLVDNARIAIDRRMAMKIMVRR